MPPISRHVMHGSTVTIAVLLLFALLAPNAGAQSASGEDLAKERLVPLADVDLVAAPSEGTVPSGILTKPVLVVENDQPREAEGASVVPKSTGPLAPFTARADATQLGLAAAPGLSTTGAGVAAVDLGPDEDPTTAKTPGASASAHERGQPIATGAIGSAAEPALAESQSLSNPIADATLPESHDTTPTQTTGPGVAGMDVRSDEAVIAAEALPTTTLAQQDDLRGVATAIGEKLENVPAALLSATTQTAATTALSQTEAKPAASSSLTFWLSCALGIALLAMSASLATLRYVVHWRRTVRPEDLAIFPEKILWDFDSTLRAQNSSLDALTSRVKQLQDHSKQRDTQHATRLSELLEAFMGLQRVLDQREREIARFRKGYDAEEFTRFIRRFLRIDEELASGMEDLGPEQSQARKVYETMRRLLEDCWEECGLDRFEPELGENIMKAHGVASRWKSLPTDQEEKHHTIAEVVEPGMRIRTPEGGEVIKQSIVKVWEYESFPEPAAAVSDVRNEAMESEDDTSARSEPGGDAAPGGTERVAGSTTEL